MQKAYFNEEELQMMLFKDSHNGKQAKIHLPNVIFDELIESIDINLPNRSSEHIAYAYSFVYLISYLYRYAIYGKVTKNITAKKLKEILQTPASNKSKDYITTSNNGILMQLNYIRKTPDVPIHVEALDHDYENFVPIFYTLSDLKEDTGKEEFNRFHAMPFNYKINYPYRAFYHIDQKGKKKVQDGYFYDVNNTHMIPLDVFIFCMSRKDLGTLGFYLYSFLKRKTDQSQTKDWRCSFKNLILFTGIKKDKLNDTLTALESYNMIFNSHEEYYANLHLAKEKVNLKSSKYRALQFKEFLYEKQEVAGRKVINCKDLEDVIKENDKAEHYMPAYDSDFNGDEIWT